MAIDVDDPKFVKRVERRVEILKRDPDAFLSRFDLNNDGILTEMEMSAAMATIINELLHEHQRIESIESTPFELGTLIDDRFELISLIGEGAQSSAFVAEDRQTNILVVVKQMRLSHLDTWEAYTAFERESEFLERLDHPQVPDLVKKLTMHRTDSEQYIFSVQGFMPGQNLETKGRVGFFFTEELLMSIAEQVLTILSYLHAHTPPILHRDIKPSNILLTDSGEVSLVDFGAVQYAEKSKTLAMGTNGFMPNEQLLGNAIPQSDIYALGVTLIRLATGTAPELLEMKNMKLVWKNKSSLSKGFTNWIDKLVQPVVEDRFSSAENALRFLRDPSFTFIKLHQRDDSLELREIFTGKPEGSGLRIWESVDQFVCTFTKIDNIEKLPFMEGVERFLRLVKHQKTLENNGGGFCMNDKREIRIQSGERIKNRNLMATGRFVSTLLTRKSFEKHLGIVSTYAIGRTSHTATIVLGLSRPELDWLWHHLSSFCKAHKFDIISPGIEY